MQAALESVDGVESTEIDFAAKTATVTVQGGTSPEALVAAVEASGFGCEVSDGSTESGKKPHNSEY